MKAAADDRASGLHELKFEAGIDACLRRLCRYRSLLTARRSGDPQGHPTAVLAVQRPLGRLLLDALPDAQYAAGTPLQFRARFDGAKLVFSCTVIGAALYGDTQALVVTLPGSIRERERRQARRLPLPSGTAVPFSVATLDGAPADVRFQFEIVDVSPLGVGARVDATPGALMIGDRLELQLELPGRSLPVSATLCTHRHEAGGVRLGLRFAELEPRQLDLLSAALLQIERRQLRATREPAPL